MALSGAPDPMSQAYLPAAGRDDYTSLGPLGPLMSNPRVTEIMVMGTRDIYVAADSKILLTPIYFGSDDELMAGIPHIGELVGTPGDNQNPPLHARLPRAFPRN